MKTNHHTPKPFRLSRPDAAQLCAVEGITVPSYLQKLRDDVASGKLTTEQGNARALQIIRDRAATAQ